ncbi:MAG: hypothetical protein P1R58_12500 [bacterium]|nr:hypothetical protein [bacterium]
MTRYLVMLAVFILVIVSLIYFKMGGDKLPEDFPRGIKRTEMNLGELAGVWIGPGLLHLPDSNRMSINARISFDPVGENSFNTKTIMSGHELNYSGTGSLFLGGDSASWILVGDSGDSMVYRGWVHNDIVWVKCERGPLEYKIRMYFTSPNRLYINSELYKDSVAESSFEYTLEKE